MPILNGPFMPHPIYDLADADCRRALAAFAKALPEEYAAFERAKATMEAYKDVPAPVRVRPQQPQVDFRALNQVIGDAQKRIDRILPESQRVIAGSLKVLRLLNQRQTSSQIAAALVKDNVSIGGDDMPTKTARVSAHLSAAKTIFDNDRAAGGYGLVEWKNPKGLPVVG